MRYEGLTHKQDSSPYYIDDKLDPSVLIIASPEGFQAHMAVVRIETVLNKWNSGELKGEVTILSRSVRGHDDEYQNGVFQVDLDCPGQRQLLRNIKEALTNCSRSDSVRRDFRIRGFLDWLTTLT